MAASIRVVIVEDNETFRETLELLLPFRAGIEVAAAVERGEEAVEVCARLEPDVALIDYRMPGLDGAQDGRGGARGLAADARDLPDGTSASSEEIRRLMAAGAVACLTKDQSLDEIVAVIRGAVSEDG